MGDDKDITLYVNGIKMGSILNVSNIKLDDDNNSMKIDDRYPYSSECSFDIININQGLIKRLFGTKKERYIRANIKRFFRSKKSRYRKCAIRYIYKNFIIYKNDTDRH